MAQFTLPDLAALLRGCAGVEQDIVLDDASLDVPFLDLGIDSLAVLQATSFIDVDHGLCLAGDAADEADTPRLFLALVNRALADRDADTVHTEVAVVGAGPAGLALALMLLRSGVQCTLIERSPSAPRDFHGEILQPGGQHILDELGVLDAAAERGAATLHGFQVLEGSKLLLDIDYRRLKPPYNRLLALPQRHVLDELLERCRTLPGFSYLEGGKLVELIEDDGRTYGAVVTAPGGRRMRVRAEAVVGCDGRFSKTRRLAGIEAPRIDAFAHDVVWFTLPAQGTGTGRVRVHRAGATTALVHDSWPDRLRIGWTLPHGSWPQTAARGIGEIRDRLAAALPEFAALIHDHLQMNQLSLLDVFAAQADTWVRDGLVLAGDSAHTHGPLGAQGINLALADAAALHPLLVAAVADRDCSRRRLEPFETQRAAAAQAVTRMQHLQAKAFFGSGGRASAVLRRRAARAVTRTPAAAVITRRIAYGKPQVRVRTDLFEAGKRESPQAARDRRG